MTTVPRRPATVTRRPARPRLRAYLRLAKLDIVDYYLALPVAWALLAPADRLAARDLVTLALFLLGEVCVIAASVALDDVTGYRDGSDATNYGPNPARRRLARKPLLSGALAPADAIRFGWSAALAGLVLWGAAVAVAPYGPGWVVTVGGLCLLGAVQYSWGLKISYRGFQETFLLGFGVGVVLVPYGLLCPSPNGFAVVQAVLFGAGPMLFGLYSNTHDVAGDALVGRRTVAVLASPRGNAVFVAALTLAELALVAVAAGIGPAPWWFALAALPVAVARLAELVVGLRLREILLARRIAIWDHRLTVAVLVAVDLLHPLAGSGAAG